MHRCGYNWEGEIMEKTRFKCHKISEGCAEGVALVSNDTVMFYLINPKTGEFIEKGHDLEGKNVSRKVMIFPGGKGSSVVQADGLYQLNMNGNMPKGMIIKYPETVLISSAIIMEIPMVDRVDDEFYKIVKDGDDVIINADEEYVEIIR